jgi:hypothetical protein
MQRKFFSRFGVCEQRSWHNREAATNTGESADLGKTAQLNCTFTRAVVVDFPADLKIGLRATAVKATSWSLQVLILAGTFVVLGLFGWLARSSLRRHETHPS